MGRLRKKVFVVCWLAIFTTPVAAQTSPSVAAAPQEKKMGLKKLTIGTIHPIHAWNDIYLAGQPSPEDLSRLKEEQRVKTIINLRQTQEVPWDQAAAVKQLGMKYVHVPFQSPQQLKPEVFDQVLKVLRDKEQRPVMLHCASSNRVGALWYAYRVLDGGLSPDAAMKEAQTVGLRTPEFLMRAQAYVESAQGAGK